jgi:peptidoglycan/xylan/chitin deacetylase (PgdA/CDA1 family)
MYHRVASESEDAHLDPGLRSATPDGFDAQLEMLASEFRVVSSLELLAAIDRDVELSSKSVVITFDDAYASFVDTAWPALCERGLPATLFVPTAFPGPEGESFWWDRLWGAFVRSGRSMLPTPIGSFELDAGGTRSRRAHRALSAHVKTLEHGEAMSLVDDLVDSLGGAEPCDGIASWEQLRQIRASGATLASHTRTHAILPAQTRQRVVEELEGAEEDLLRELGPTPPFFAYPSGRSSSQVKEVLEERGYQLAFGTSFGVNDVRANDRLSLRRIDVTRSLGTGTLRALLHPMVARAAARIA